MNKRSKKRSYSREASAKAKTRRDDKQEYAPKPSRDGSNDYRWYANDEQLLRDAASIPFSWSVGTELDAKAYLPSVPGVQVEFLIPSIGWSTDPNSPVNLASASIYSFVRHVNSGHSNYDAPDFMIYLLAVSNMYSFLNWAQRIYGYSMLYAQQNRFLPGGLFAADKVDKDSLINNLANYRYGINVLINKLSSLAVPSVFSIYMRHAFLYQNVYCEGESIKDQLYMYSPYGFFKFSLDETGAGQLVLQPLHPLWGDAADKSLTYQDILAYGNDLLDAILVQEDMNIMSGDVLKAFGSDGIIKMVSLPEQYLILPVYNAEVLHQMKNATSLGMVQSGAMTDAAKEWYAIKQDPTHGFLLHRPLFFGPDGSNVGDSYKYVAEFVQSNKVLTLDTATPTPVDVIESTRLMVGFHSEKIGDVDVLGLYCGSEICVETRIIAGVTGASVSCDFATVPGQSPLHVSNLSAYWAPFKFHPAAAAVYPNAYAAYAHFDIDNYAVLTSQDLKKLHETAIMSQLHLNSIAKVAMS